jgi:ADP-heptose:LPS heptosyltransferase
MRDFMTELLIIKPSSLGDIVHGLQVATSLKAQARGLRISWVVRDIFAPIVRACAAVDQVYVFERNAGTKGFLRLMKRNAEDQVRLRLRHAGSAAHGADDLAGAGEEKGRPQ